jgi:N-terminal domain of reverse transcriptase
MDGWNTIDWKEIQRGVFKLQKRIYRAYSAQAGAFDKCLMVEEPCDVNASSTVL